MPESVDVFMRDSDAFSWYMERDPALRSTIVAVAWLDRQSGANADAWFAGTHDALRCTPAFRSLRLIVGVAARILDVRLLP